MAFSGIAQGIGGETEFAEKGRQQKRTEARENLSDQLAIEQALQNRKRTNILEEGAQTRLRQLELQLLRMNEWKTVGQPKQMKDGSWAELQFQPVTGQTRWQPTPNPYQGGGFETPDERDVAKSMSKYRAYQKAQTEGAPQAVLDRIFPPAERYHWLNTQEGIVGFPNLPGYGYAPSPFRGWPPGYGSAQNQGDPSEIPYYAESYRRGDIEASQIPTKLRGSVMRYMQNLGMGKGYKLSAIEQRQMDDVVKLKPFIDKLKSEIEGRGLENSNGWADSLAALRRGATYSLHRRPNDPIAQGITPIIASVKVMGSAPWATIGRGRYLFDEIQLHVPSFYDTPAQMYDKLNNLENIVDQTRFDLTLGKQGDMGPGVDMSGVSGNVQLPGGKNFNLQNGQPSPGTAQPAPARPSPGQRQQQPPIDIPRPEAPVRTPSEARPEAPTVNINGVDYFVIGTNPDGTPKLAEFHNAPTGPNQDEQ